MAKIQAVGAHCVATLTEPDGDGDYGWMAPCGAASTEVRPMDEAIAHAEIHVDACKPVLVETCEQCRERPGVKMIDPYQQELEGIDVEMILCEVCEQSRRDDI